MKASWKTGLSFGLTSGVITTLGLMVGLHSGTHSRAVVIGGILTIAMSFVVPVAMRPLDQAIVISVVWGMFLLAALSFFVARAQAIQPWKVIGEHLFIALCVVAITHAVGEWAQGFVEAE